VPTIRIETLIRAPIERCFDLARDPEIHERSTARTHERVVTRTGSGLLGAGDMVTFEARHFGVRQRLTARITRFERPHVFEDQMVCGAFQSFRHMHAFREVEGGTLMTDTFAFRSSLGPLGALAERLFLTGYLRRFLMARAVFLTQCAEGEADD
jgi:ligand-binding SRPBCC domain-containing protein